MAVAEVTNVRGITSGMARCARQGAYAALHTEPDPPLFEMEEFYRRGHFMERLRLMEWDARYPGEVEKKRPIPWEAAGRVFHGEADGYHTPERKIIEVVSSVSPSRHTIGLKVAQARTYVALDSEAESAVVDVIDPSRLAPADQIAVVVTDDHRAEVQAKVAAVGLALESNGAEMPARVCDRPGQAQSMLCPFASTCFAGFEEPSRFEITDPKAMDAAARVLSAEADERIHKAALKEVAEAKKQAQADLLEYTPEGKSVVGPFDISRWHVNGREDIDRAAADAAGVDLTPFVKQGAGHDRIAVKKTMRGDNGDIDYGSVPF